MSRSTTTPLTFQSDLPIEAIIPGDPAGIPIMPPEGMGEAAGAGGRHAEDIGSGMGEGPFFIAFMGVEAEAIPDAQRQKMKSFLGSGPDPHIPGTDAADAEDKDSEPPFQLRVDISKSTLA